MCALPARNKRTSLSVSGTRCCASESESENMVVVVGGKIAHYKRPVNVPESGISGAPRAIYAGQSKAPLTSRADAGQAARRAGVIAGINVRRAAVARRPPRPRPRPFPDRRAAS